MVPPKDEHILKEILFIYPILTISILYFRSVYVPLQPLPAYFLRIG